MSTSTVRAIWRGRGTGTDDVRSAVQDPNGDAEDEVMEYLNDAGIETEVSYENPQTEGKPCHPVHR